MQAAVLTHARLHGASLRDADLEGASLQYARLLGADLTGAKLAAADLRRAAVWQASPPPQENLALADLDTLDLTPPSDEEITALAAMIERIPNPAKDLVEDALEQVLDAAKRRQWETSAQRQNWHQLMLASASSEPNYSAELTDHLLRLMCHSRWSNGSIATGVAKRAQAPQFRGDITAVHNRLTSKDCPASQTVAKKPVRELMVAVDSIRYDRTTPIEPFQATASGSGN